MAKGNEYQEEDFKELTGEEMDRMHGDLDEHLTMQAIVAKHDEKDGKSDYIKEDPADRDFDEDDEDDGDFDEDAEDDGDFDEDDDNEDEFKGEDGKYGYACKFCGVYRAYGPRCGCCKVYDEEDTFSGPCKIKTKKSRGIKVTRLKQRKVKERANDRRKHRIQDIKHKKALKVGRLVRACIKVYSKHGIPLSISNQVLLDLVNSMKPDAKKYAISRFMFSAKLKTRLRKVAYELFNVGGRFLIVDRDTLIEMLNGKTINADMLVAEAVGLAAKVDGSQE